MPYLLGLTGNIACGKSSVGQLLAARPEVEYIDADAVVHALYESGTPEVQAILAYFGPGIRSADGTIDRRALGDLVMADPAALRALERILIPGVRARIQALIAGATRPVLVLDAIKLIEAGYVEQCQAVWVVTCTRATQLARLMATRGLTRAQAVARIDAQGPQSAKVRHATRIIPNDGDLSALRNAVEAAWARDIAPHLAADRQ
ncbi:MAG: dephospho-CoA kinase [Chloroflexi bacterium]|nr:dephospho-CoA kinase [Chloroflexota bacterium]